MSTPSKLYESRLASLAIAAGPPRMRFPLPDNSLIQFAAYAFDQEFEMLLWNPTTGAKLFPPAPKNTPSNATSGGNAIFAGLLDGNAILTKLSQPSPTGGGRGKFTGSFTVVPASWDDFKTQGVTFPGWLDTTAGSGARTALSQSVNVRLHYDYFLVDPAGIAAGALDSGGGTITVVAEMGEIPSNLRTIFLAQGASYPIVGSQAKDLSNGVTVGEVFWQVTYPSVTQYQAMMATAAPFATSSAWTETTPPKCAIVGGPSPTNNFSTAGQYRFADSSLRPYAGNIIERCSYYVLPQ